MIAIGYAFFFRLIGVEQPVAVVGGRVLVHYTLAGPVVNVLPSMDPTGENGRQGFAYKNYGMLDVVTAFVGPLAFGTLTGIFYGFFHSGGGAGLAF